MLKMLKMRSDDKETHLKVSQLCSCWHVGGGEVSVLSPAVGGRVCREFKDTCSGRTLRNSFNRPSHSLHENTKSIHRSCWRGTNIASTGAVSFSLILLLLMLWVGIPMAPQLLQQLLR